MLPSRWKLWSAGLAWEPDKLVVGRVDEVMPHPNADRLVLCRLFDGEKEHIVLTGAPNLFDYKGQRTARETAQGGLCQGRRAHL